MNKVVIFPNPATGPTVSILPAAYSGISNVRIEIYTIAFRKVLDTTLPSVLSGTVVNLSLKDRGGNNLADGIYYVAVTTSKGRSMGKLLVLK